jgi:SAM-dependent methyltransferase
MAIDVVDLRTFYASPLGHLARGYLGRTIVKLWPDMKGQRLLGLGFTTPYLSLLRDGTERTLAFMPATQGVVNWPSGALSASALVEPTELPLPDACIDRVLIVHALETSESPEDLLSEIWRVLNPGGRVLAVVPSRRGLWARMDTTPFGNGQPFSRLQLEGLMRRTMFSPEAWAETLYMPPVPRRIMMRTAPIWEKIGTSLSLPFAGVHVIEATKQFYRRVPARPVRRGFVLQPMLMPQPASSPARQSCSQARQIRPGS